MVSLGFDLGLRYRMSSVSKCANWRGANMRVVHGGHFWQFGSIAFLATETTDGEILVAFLAQTWPQIQSHSA